MRRAEAYRAFPPLSSDQPSQFTIAGQRGFRQRGKKDAPQSLRERSRFVLAEAAEEGGGARGRWLYREGTPEGEGYKGNQASSDVAGVRRFPALRLPNKLHALAIVAHTSLGLYTQYTYV